MGNHLFTRTFPLQKRNGIEKNGMTIFWGTENEKTEIR